ncbi:MAG: histidine kinase [Pseudomonas sp.]|jgi:uncharacterized membrane protein affecting hemolysin expression|nr:histidine kinase [Pseudomonas sp.]
MHSQLKWSIQQQADALGQSLLQQTSLTAQSALSASDTLSLAVLLRELVNNPYVKHAAIYSVDNRVLAEAGLRPKSSSTEKGFYSQQLAFQDVITGSLHLHIDMQKLRKPLINSLQSMAVLGVILLILAVFLSAHLGRSVALPLQHLSNWLINPVPPAPYAQRSDEVGLLARQLNDYFILDTQNEDIPTLEPISEQTPDTSGSRSAQVDDAETDDADVFSYNSALDTIPLSALDNVHPCAPPQAAERTTILAVQFGNIEQLRQLPQERLVGLLKKYRHAVEQSALLYGGHLHTLADGRSLISFHSDSAEYPRNALCCGELLRAFGHALQIEVADSGIALHIQLGMSEGPLIKDLSLGELLLSDSAQVALDLSQHSRNLLLLNNSLAAHSCIASCSRTRTIAKPNDASCVELLLNPYPALLQSQLHHLQKNSPS